MDRQAKRLNKLTAELIGDWDGAIKFISNSGYEVKKKTEDAKWAICKKIKAIVIGHLLSQDLPWAPLSKKTRKKGKNANMILIDTETYLSNIKVWKEYGISHVGVKKGIIYKRGDSTIALDRLAIFLEKGTTSMVARPLWEPSFEELGGKEGIRNFVVDAIFRRLKWLSKRTPITITKRQVLKRI